MATSGNSESISQSSSRNICQWTDCTCVDPFDTVQELADHVNQVHVESFQTQDLVLCLWKGCKVYNVPCQKKTWLTQHMRRHTNERPHKCIMNGCNQSFWNIDALNHHLQLHLMPSPQKSKKLRKKIHEKDCRDHSKTASTSADCGNSLKKSTKTMTGSDTRPNEGSHSIELSEDLRSVSVDAIETYGRESSSNGSSSSSNMCSFVSPQPVAVNGGLIHNDSIDARVMAVIKRAIIAQYNTGSDEESSSAVRSTCTLTGKVIGQRKILKRVEPDFLVQWCPRIIPDSWIPSSQYTGYKTVPLSDLLHCQKAFLVQTQYLTTPTAVEPYYCNIRRKRKREQ